ncbi:MAG: tetratricopeptide repeat protein, partial [Acetobacteraceae bacterium]
AGMPDVAPLPALANGHVTFGYFGRTVRLNDAVIEAWSRILHAVPNARLVLNNSPFAEAAGRERMAARFAAYGIARERLDLICTAPQPATWAAYGTIDIALDPFPHNAGTTTIEALWQGVPVVTLAGRPTVGRFGAAILHAVGLDDWVTDSIDAYVARAVAAAADPVALARVRAALRPDFQASPLHDARGLARAIEAAYRALWDAWRGADVQTMHRLYAAGDRTGACAAAREMLRANPGHPDALHVLAVVAFQDGDAETAIGLLRQADERADLLTDLGVMLRATGQHRAAEASYRRALALKPDLVAAWGNLGNLLLDLVRPAEAERAFAEGLALAGAQPWLLRGRALALMTRQEMEQAEPLLRQALALAPDDAEVHETLGVLLGQTGRPVEAEAHHRAGLPGLRDRQRGLGNLAICLQAQGRHQEAEACHRQAIAIRPDYASGHGNLLFALNYRHDLSAEDIFAEYQRWNEQHARALAPRAERFELDLTPGRRLRVGYVSPDFRRHVAALFAEPLLAAHDRSRIELFCYADVAVEDEATGRFRALADHWRATSGMNDAALAETVRRDRIDVLVDLAGHTGSNRLLAFARRPAPVQIAYILGHGTTTGMSAMDAFLADEALVPHGADALFSERLVRLTRIPLVYQPPETMPAVAPLPALSAGHVTFGYFGRVERLNPRVIAVWSRILAAVPGARLVLNAAPFGEAAFRDLYVRRFAEHGIAAERLSLICTVPQSRTWAEYGAIDIALDPFPHNAGTTTIEALWLGVPVLSLLDRPTVGRFGASILGAVGLSDWVAPDDNAYVARAVAAASDLDALSCLRAGLRARFEASPLRDAAGLAREVEDAFQLLWHAWRDRACLPVAAE